MKFPLSWLREFIDIPDIEIADIVEAFESLGHEVEEAYELNAAFSGVIVGKVVQVAPHPNADKVRVCQVDIGSGVSEIICGAWNFEAGAYVPVAVPGAVLGDDFTITQREIRGIVSNGMICSEAELGLGDDADGIMVLNDDYPGSTDAVGTDFAAIVGYPDLYFDISITPNRPDCMSVVGLARELGARLDLPLVDRMPELDVVEDAVPLTISIQDDRCPRFTARTVRGISVGESPHWMRRRLSLAGMRPINNVVDASNYVMMELGHPSHAFDRLRLGDSIGVRRAVEGETIATLDDLVRTLVADDIVVVDGVDRPVSIGGIMGGASTEVHAESVEVVIESAMWFPPMILHSSKRLQLRSEASARFERGMDPNFTMTTADRVAELLVAHAGGTAGSAYDVYPSPVEPLVIEYPLSETRRILGIDLDTSTSTAYLEKLDFSVTGDDPLRVVVPTRRPDVQRPVDLVEELARLHGFASIPGRVVSGTGGGLPADIIAERKLRRVLTALGLNEAMTFAFIGHQDLDVLRLAENDPRRDAIDVVNPLRDEEGVMRTTLLPGLIKTVAANHARGFVDLGYFEIGKVFLRSGGALPAQPDHLGFILTGERGGDIGGEARSVDVRDGVGIIERLSETMRVGLAIEPAVESGFHPGRCGQVVIDGQVIGTVGELRPSVAAAAGLKGRVVIGELALAPLVAAADPWTLVPPSSYPPVVFDLAFETGADVRAGSVVQTIRSAAGPELESVSIFDVYSGTGIGEGRISIAVRLSLRAADRTLTESEVTPMRKSIVEAVESGHDATLRGSV
ncbi:phenylalanine--tRNA ligase beta subunit [bacterium BMS3Bbin02]|nr:phenylalanine--tRNA ligase beta subunit [bacterium BMS3Bbin02]